MLSRRLFVALLALAGLFPAATRSADPAPAKRVISLSAPLAETMYELGAENRLIAVTDVAVFPERILADRRAGKIKELGSFMKPDLALLRQLKPDLILSDTGFNHTLADSLKAEGFRVLHYEATSLDQIMRQILEVGSAVGKQKKAAEIVNQMKQDRAAILAKSKALPPVRVYMEINHEGPWTIGSASPVNDLIEAAGGRNIFADQNQGTFVTTNDEIVRRNPEIILSPIWVNAKVGGIDGIIPLAQIFQRPGYAATAAVQNSRVLYYDSALLKHEGPRQILAIRKLAHLLHPREFPDPPGTIPWELGRILE